MLFLHAGFRNDRLWLWGEVPPRPGTDSADSGQPPLSPFTPSAAHLTEILAELGLSAPANGTRAVVELPTIAGQPVPSSPLLGSPPARGKVRTARWTVAALPLTPGESLELLGRCVGRDTLQRGVGVGLTLAYWTGAMRYAGALVARAQMLPGLRAEGKEWHACWQPIVAGPEQVRCAALAQAMPPACRALLDEDGTTLPAAALLAGFLRMCVDAIVRRTVPAALTRRAPAKFATVHDAWLAALGAADSLVKGTPADLAGLAEQIRTWQRPVLSLLDTPFRLCFRLEEPVGPSADWVVRYLLQARDDPSLLLSAKDSWAPRGDIATQFRQRDFRPREYLLTALGQAATLCPGVEVSLRQATPGAFTTDISGAHAFLTDSAARLEQSGFGVLLPSWWTGARPRLSLRGSVSTPKMTAPAGLTLDAVLDIDWHAALGDTTLSPAELDALARLKEPLVQLRGQWVEVRPDEIKALLEQWERKQEKATLQEVVRLALGQGERAGVEVTGIDATGWLKEFLDEMQTQVGFAEVAPSPNLQAELRPYQRRGLSWLLFLRRWRLGACLADDMGLGKTLQTLATILHDTEQGATRPVLLVCPTSVLSNWQCEANRFTPSLGVLIHHGPARNRGAAFLEEVARHPLVVTSYSLLQRDSVLLGKVAWAGVVLDEAQNIKNPQTKQARAARSLPADYRVLLTGTPVENHVGDLWSLFEFLNPGLLGNQADFRRRFFLPIQTGRDPAAADRLKRLTGPFILRRLKTDKAVIADLPDKVEMKVFCPLTKEQASLYQAVVRAVEHSLEESEGIQRRGLILKTLGQLKQVCNHPAHFLGDHSSLPDRSGKLERVTQLVEEILAVGERALLFTQYTEMGDLLRTYLQDTFGREVLFLHGGIVRKQRDALVARFQGEGGPPLFILSLKAGGTGLNLTAASHVIHYDRWWNPAVENQATDRAFRIGQTRKVLVHKCVCTGTLEEKIDAMIERKSEIAGKVVGAGEQWLTELSNTQLRELLTLSPDAVEE
jgi:SNF2 family DNA or RNA helicase